MCRILKVSPSGFYDWLKDPSGVRGREDDDLCEDIRRIFADSEEAYGN